MFHVLDFCLHKLERLQQNFEQRTHLSWTVAKVWFSPQLTSVVSASYLISASLSALFSFLLILIGVLLFYYFKIVYCLERIAQPESEGYKRSK